MRAMCLKFCVTLFFALVQISGTVQTLNAQNTFEKSFGYDSLDEGHSVKQTLDGGYIIVGYTVNYLCGLGHDYAIRLNSLGDTIWTRSYGTQYDQSMANAVQLTNDGGFIIAGYAQPYSGNGYLYLVKANESGDTMWTKRISSGVDYTCGYSVQQTNDGGYVVCGIKETIFSTTSQIFLVKTDANGTQQWAKTYGGANREIGYDVSQTSDGGFVIVGGSQSFGAGDWDFYMVKTDASGNLIWEKHYGDSAGDIAYSVKQTTDGGYAILGESDKIVQNHWVIDLFLIKTNSNGDTLWTKKYSGNVYCEHYSLDLGCNDGYILAGAKVDSLSGYSDAYLIKTDDFGNVTWSKTFGGLWDDGSYSVEKLNDGYIVIGYCDVGGNGMQYEDVYAIRVSSYGALTSVIDPNAQNALCKVAPNPFSKSTMINFDKQIEFNFSLYDIFGKDVMNLKGNSNQFTIDRGVLPNGVYFYNIKSESETISKGKLVIE